MAWKNIKFNARNSLRNSNVYYRYIIHNLLAINELHGNVCTVNRAVRSRPQQPVKQPNDGGKHDQGD